jgi:NAD(P)-dependent dehydrogenase (short-subunit alcohol dehydrogenase family)
MSGMTSKTISSPHLMATAGQAVFPHVAIVTGASRGLGLALTTALAQRGWRVVADGRNAAALQRAVGHLASVTAVPGDVSDAAHRDRLRAAAAQAGGVDLLVNNASLLGPSPQPPLADYPLDVFRRVYEVNVLAPLALVQCVLPLLTGRGGVVVNVSSDAGGEAYAGWGGYGSSKAALDQISAVLAVEHPDQRIYAFDPGDMNTQMHQEAFPGEDISDRPSPDSVVPALLRLVDTRLPSGRYRAAQLLADAPGVSA